MQGALSPAEAARAALAIADPRLAEAFDLGARVAVTPQATPASAEAHLRNQLDAERHELAALRQQLQDALDERDTWRAEHDRVLAKLEATQAAQPAAALARRPAIPLADPPAAPEAPAHALPDGSYVYDPHEKKWTDARLDLARELWGDLSVTTSEILDRVNALPGAPIASKNALSMGVKKYLALPGSRLAYADQLAAEAPAQPDPAEDQAPEPPPAEDTAPAAEDQAPTIPDDAISLGVEDGEAVAEIAQPEGGTATVALPARTVEPSAEASPPLDAEEAPQAGESRSEDRLALLRRLWPQPDVSVQQILQEWNALPGRPLGHFTSIYTVAKAIGLPQPRSAALEVTRVAATAEPAANANDERLARAKDLLRRGRAGAAVMREAGITEAELRALNEALHAEADQALAAKEDTARRLLEDGENPDQVAKSTKLPLREIIRLQAELRGRKRA